MRFYHKKYAIFLCIGTTKGTKRLFVFFKKAVIKKSENAENSEWVFFLHEFPQFFWWKRKNLPCLKLVKDADLSSSLVSFRPRALSNYFCLLSREGKKKCRKKIKNAKGKFLHMNKKNIHTDTQNNYIHFYLYMHAQWSEFTAFSKGEFFSLFYE